jgi:hypothetical protein
MRLYKATLNSSFVRQLLMLFRANPYLTLRARQATLHMTLAALLTLASLTLTYQRSSGSANLQCALPATFENILGGEGCFSALTKSPITSFTLTYYGP